MNQKKNGPIFGNVGDEITFYFEELRAKRAEEKFELLTVTDASRGNLNDEQLTEKMLNYDDASKRKMNFWKVSEKMFLLTASRRNLILLENEGKDNVFI